MRTPHRHHLLEDLFLLLAELQPVPQYLFTEGLEVDTCVLANFEGDEQPAGTINLAFTFYHPLLDEPLGVSLFAVPADQVDLFLRAERDMLVEEVRQQRQLERDLRLNGLL